MKFTGMFGLSFCGAPFLTKHARKCLNLPLRSCEPFNANE